MSLNKLGRYDLIRVLGKGAMGLVYEGRDPNLDRRVAIKTIRVENLSDEDAAEYEVRFRTEARSAARLQHPNIVSVYDSDRDLDIAYLVMEFIQGEDLKYHLDKGDVYTLEQTLGIMRDLLSALDYAHRQSIVHRDIKPANLLIEANGRVKLTDFGVARIQNSGEATRTQGTMVGTLKYMSPEQIQGRPVDARADLFAAGIVLHQLLTGQRPFDGESDFAVIQQIVSHHPVAPSTFNPKLPPALDAVLARALAKSRDQRYLTAHEFSAALHEAIRQAADQTVTPLSIPKDKRAFSTWTATLRPGESLLSTQPGTGLMTHTGTNSGGSNVTQELELVYWKDIKDSVDVEDINVFLAKFPAGIYADLARRRLKKMAHPSGEGSDIGLAAHTPLMSAAPAEADTDKTVMMPRQLAHTVGLVAVSPAHATPVAESATVENLKTTSQAIEEAVEEATPVPLGSTVAEHALSTTGDAPSFAVVAEVAEVVEDKASKSAQPTKTPMAPAISTAAATAPQSVSQIPARLPSRADIQTPPGPVAATNTQRRLVWSAAGVVALACAGLGVKLLSGSPAADSSLAIATAASTPVIAVVSAPTPSGPLALPSTASLADVVAINSTLAVASAASAPVASASAAAALKAALKAALAQAATKKAAIEKDRLAKLALEKNVVKPTVAAGVLATPSTPAADSPAAAAPAQAGVASNPRQACEDRVLIGFQICMRDQCAKPAFVNHPTCVERKAMEQQRRDVQTGK